MPEDQLRIFIVEDDFLIAFEMTDLLQDMGFEVVGPSLHVEDAEEIAASEPIDAAFLDVNLGAGETSEAVAQRLRERGVPFVFITAYSPDQITFRLPGDRVVNKPISSRGLLQALRTVLPEAEVPIAAKRN